MDPLTTLYQRLRQRTGCAPSCIDQPPLLEDWLRYWNGADTELGNLRNFEHWLSRSTAVRAARPLSAPTVDQTTPSNAPKCALECILRSQKS